MESKTKKQLSEMTFEELLIARNIVDSIKNDKVRNQNYAMASEYRTKQIKIEVEIMNRFEEQFDI